MNNLDGSSNTIYLSLGSNIGSKINNIDNAVGLLSQSGIISNIVQSSYYETEPYGYVEQDTFVNIALKANTCLSIFELLYFAKSVEYLLGRKIRQRWHNREIDIDIIFYNDLIYESNYLTIPHLYFKFRNFVLVPLVEIEPNLIDPISHKSITELLKGCSDVSIVKKIIK